MLELLNTIPGTILSVGAIAGTVIAGGMFLIGIFKKNKDDGGDRLVETLQKTVDALKQRVDIQEQDHTQKVTELTEKIDLLTTKVDKLEKENETLTKVLQGRDEQTQTFYKKAFEAMELANKTYDLVQSIDKNHVQLMKVLMEHLKPGVVINN